MIVADTTRESLEKAKSEINAFKALIETAKRYDRKSMLVSIPDLEALVRYTEFVINEAIAEK